MPLGYVVSCGVVVQMVALLAARRLRGSGAAGRLGHLDAGLGAVAGLVALGLGVWICVPPLAGVPGELGSLVRGSETAGFVTDHLGRPPTLFDGVTRSLGLDRLRAAVEGLERQTRPPDPPTSDPLPAALRRTVSRSVVRVSGVACDRVQSGSGFVLDTGRIVTNAHVIAGAADLRITNDSGMSAPASPVYFDPEHDIAVLAAQTGDAQPLRLRSGVVGEQGSVLGYRGGGPLLSQPFRIADTTRATGRDIYDRTPTVRTVMVLGSRMGPGDSGAPLVATDGSVVGMAFAISLTNPDTAFAIPAEALVPLLTPAGHTPVSTGPCTN
ncbi:MAG: trypsin-like peptidase domain-containing protein [Microthrixaceae bacterium]